MITPVLVLEIWLVYLLAFLFGYFVSAYLRSDRGDK